MQVADGNLSAPPPKKKKNGAEMSKKKRAEERSARKVVLHLGLNSDGKRKEVVW